MTNQPKIREATAEDMPEILRMGELFCQQAELPFNAESVVNTATQMIENPGAVILIGSGAMAGVLAYPLFMDQSVIAAEELFWWVDEDKRSAGLGKELVDSIQSWAESLGANRLLMSGLASSPGHVAEFYEKSGYSLLEIKYFKEL